MNTKQMAGYFTIKKIIERNYKRDMGNRGQNNRVLYPGS